MEYVLYVPGMSFNGETIARGNSLGGSESAGYYLARELARRGHGVTVFSQIAPDGGGCWEGVAYLPIGPRSEAAPCGENFEAYAAVNPHDVLIGQRVPGLFHRPTAGKVNLWWTHDLALRRHLPALSRQLWNLSGVLCVSQFHRAQVAEVYGIDPARIAVVPNGVDGALFPDPLPARVKRRGKTLIYSSRPERGLAHLLGGISGDGPGIMERLAAADPEITLKVCGYDNTAPEMEGFYGAVVERCRALPNVEWLGALSKGALARLMADAWLHVYPTTFEEVSCITAMEAQVAGTPIVTSPVAALPETLRDGGVHWVPLLETEGKAPEIDRPDIDREAFARDILSLAGDPERYARLCENAADKSTKSSAFAWSTAADAVEATVAQCLERQCAQPGRMARHLMRHSDIPALRKHLETLPEDAGTLVERTRTELDTCYAFAVKGTEDGAGEAQQSLSRHYEAYYAYEQERGVEYGPESLDGNPRFEAVARHVASLPGGAAVLDYGCAHGHYTVNLARRFPALRFIGMDLVKSNIVTARKWAALEKLENVAFHAGSLAEHREGLPSLALVIAGEVLEHVPDPGALADALGECLAGGEKEERGHMLITTPFGPWEAEGFAEHHPWRAHLHHLERADLADLFGRHPRFAVQTIPIVLSSREEPLGSFLTTFAKPVRPSGAVNLERKLKLQAPRETLSVCMIVSAEGDTLARCLKSVAPLADEFILGIDGGEEGRAWELARQYGARAFSLASPLAEGFHAARNATIDKAEGDWILWIDDDEELLWPVRLAKYLRDNGYDAYAIKQHHYAVEPGGIIKTDFPCRLFRNRRGFRFHGYVHEHPELGVNKGAGNVLLLPDVAICHNGYVTEEVRRARFQRNLPLMLKDREHNGERLLGRFLWIRDLAHLNRFEYEQSGAVTPEMRARAEEAVALWRGLLADNQVRMAVDALPYYSEAVALLTGGEGGGIDCKLELAISRMGLGDVGDAATGLQGHFMDTRDIQQLTAALLKEKTALVEGKYV